MVCPKCGREMTNNSCPYCNNTGPVVVNSVDVNTQLTNTVPIVNQPVNTNVVNNVQTNNTVSNTNVSNNKQEVSNNSGKFGFFLKYLIVTFILILFTILGTYLVTKKMIDSKYTNMNKEVHLNGYMYRLDNSLNTDVLNDRLLISNNSKNYRILISPSNIAFDMYKDNLTYIKNLYIQRGYKINNPKSKTFNGVEYLTMEIFKDNHNELLSITRGNSNNTSYVAVVECGSNLVDYSVLEEIAPIIKNIKYKSVSNRMIPSEDRLLESQKVLIK